MDYAEAMIAGQQFLLHPYKGLFWKEEEALLVADLHLGKAMHFRRSGIPVPGAVGDENWQRLFTLIDTFQPKRVLLLGDLFHSTYNQRWEDFGDFLKHFPDLTFELIAGNHDILSLQQYERFGLIYHPKPVVIRNLLLSHEPVDASEEGHYNLAGHIHPCVYLRGRGKQRLRMPCFYFGEHQGLLPAFGQFTGMAGIEVKEGDEVFVVMEEGVVKV
jgi:DNA ligase-associated metallophosphoesterase